MMARFPQADADAGSRVKVLNDYLSQVHDAAGSLETDSAGAPKLKAYAVKNASIAGGTIATAQLYDVGAAVGVAPLESNTNLPNSHTPDCQGAAALSATIATEGAAVLALGTANTINDYGTLVQGELLAESFDSKASPILRSFWFTHRSRKSSGALNRRATDTYHAELATRVGQERIRVGKRLRCASANLMQETTCPPLIERGEATPEAADASPASQLQPRRKVGRQPCHYAGLRRSEREV